VLIDQDERDKSGKTLISTSSESTHATESWDAAFRAYSCPGENEDAVGGGKRWASMEW
jgi:hypothetical protein